MARLSYVGTTQGQLQTIHDEGNRLKALGRPRREWFHFFPTGASDGDDEFTHCGNPGVSADGKRHQPGKNPIPQIPLQTSLVFGRQ